MDKCGRRARRFPGLLGSNHGLPLRRRHPPRIGARVAVAHGLTSRSIANCSKTAESTSVTRDRKGVERADQKAPQWAPCGASRRRGSNNRAAPDLTNVSTGHVRTIRCASPDAMQQLRADPAFTRVPIVAFTPSHWRTRESPHWRGLDQVIAKSANPDDLISPRFSSCHGATRT